MCVFRLSRYQQFKDFQRRILVATNLFGRGMDIERVNIVFNYDMPEDSDTYLHRVSFSSRLVLMIICVCYGVVIPALRMATITHVEPYKRIKPNNNPHLV